MTSSVTPSATVITCLRRDVLNGLPVLVEHVDSHDGAVELRLGGLNRLVVKVLLVPVDGGGVELVSRVRQGCSLDWGGWGRVSVEGRFREERVEACQSVEPNCFHCS